MIEKHPLLQEISKAIAKNGGRALLVGGAVRDLFFGYTIKDIDVEVHGIPLDQLEGLLALWGPVDLVGKSFGVLRIRGINIDWSVPRADSAGRKPTVFIDPHMSIKKAFERRDLTINAMGIDLLTTELIDPFGGIKDLKARRLRAPNIQLFVEDPLRFFRVMHFIGRFEMYPDAELNRCCAQMSLAYIAKERIEEEFEKLLLRSKRPSLGIRWLSDIGRIAHILPELAQTQGVPQEPKWHPEGDVFEHSMQVLDAAARITYDNNYYMLVMRYAALCHDIGKATTTTKEDSRWRSFGHDVAGVPLTRTLLKRLTNNQDLIADVCLLVRHHMAPGAFAKGNAGPGAYKRLAFSLNPRMNLTLLSHLAQADFQGRNGQGHEPLTEPSEDARIFLECAQRIAVAYHPEKPIVLGRDLLDKVPPGPELGKLVKYAYRLQIDTGITDKEALVERVLAYLERKHT